MHNPTSSPYKKNTHLYYACHHLHRAPPLTNQALPKAEEESYNNHDHNTLYNLNSINPYHDEIAEKETFILQLYNCDHMIIWNVHFTCLITYHIPL